MYSDRRGNGQKPPRTKPSRQKTPHTKFPRTTEREFVQGAFVRVFCTRPTKNRGGPRCVTYFLGVPGCVTKGDRGRGLKIGQKWRDVLYGRAPLFVNWKATETA